MGRHEMGGNTSGNGRTAKRARKSPIAVIVIALVVVLAIYTGVVGGVEKLPSWLRPIASAVVGGGGNGSGGDSGGGGEKADDQAPAIPDLRVSEMPAAEERPAAAPKPVAKEESRPIPAGSYHANGRVIKLLPDDDDGIRHQKFLIRLPDGSTLLVVHNVDLAPRLDDLAPGDEVEVCGEFVENDRGGLVHWTHHAPPRSKHSAGWIRHLGKIYE